MFSKRNLVLILAPLIAVSGGGFYLYSHSHKPTKENGDNINLRPATKQEQQDSESHKTTSAQKTTSSRTASSTVSKRGVSPYITSWTQDNINLYINGAVPGIVEDGGTCKITLAMSDKSVTRSRLGHRSATSTSCGRFSIPLSDLGPGTWQAILNYSSQQATGSSTETNIMVN